MKKPGKHCRSCDDWQNEEGAYTQVLTVILTLRDRCIETRFAAWP